MQRWAGQRLIPDALGAAGVAQVMDYALIVLISAVPFAFLVGLLRSSLSRAGAVSALVERLGGISARDALAEALGDDTLALAYWLPEPGFFVDAEGRRVELPAPGSGRAVSEIERDGERMAAVVHDASLLDHPELVRAAGAAAALALRTSASTPSCAPVTTSCARPALVWWPPGMRRAAGWSVTSTMARSSASSRSP